MLLTRGAGSYTNDTNGNTLTGGGRSNTWDGQNRLTQCVYGGTTTNHIYGNNELRYRTVQGANTPGSDPRTRERPDERAVRSRLDRQVSTCL